MDFDKDVFDINDVTKNITIVLVEPQMGENIGATARAMANFGLSNLCIVAPRDGWPNSQALAMATRHATYVLDSARVCCNINDAVFDSHFIFATTTAYRDISKLIMTPDDAAKKIISETYNGNRVCVLFGRENNGLNNDELALADNIITIPTYQRCASLNLSQAVLIISYSIHLAINETVYNEYNKRVANSFGNERNNLTRKNEGKITRHELNILMLRVTNILSKVDFFSEENRCVKVVKRIFNIIMRCSITNRELKILHGIITALERKINNDINNCNDTKLQLDSGSML